MNDAKIWKHLKKVATTPTPWLVTVEDWELDGPYLVVVWACDEREAESLALDAYVQNVGDGDHPPDEPDTDAVPLQKPWHWIGKTLT